MEPIKLEGVDTPTRSVLLPGTNRQVAVKPIDGGSLRLLQKLREEIKGKDFTGTRKMWEIAQRCLPDATPEEIDALTAVMVNKVIDLATETVVEQAAELPRPTMAPSGSGPET